MRKLLQRLQYWKYEEEEEEMEGEGGKKRPGERWSVPSRARQLNDNRDQNWRLGPAPNSKAKRAARAISPRGHLLTRARLHPATDTTLVKALAIL